MRRRSKTRAALIVALVVTVVLTGALLAGIGSPEPNQTHDGVTSDAPPVVAVSPAGPTTEREGLPAGFAHDGPGAVAAAIAYATAPQRWLYFSDEQVIAAVQAIATPQAGERLSEEVLGEVRAARSQLEESSGRVWWLVRPLAWSVEAFSDARSSVSVWTLTVLSAEEVAVPQCEWVTITIDLEWADGDWRVDAVRDAPGPTPLPGPGDQPWDAVPFDEALAGFTRMDGEPVT